VDRRDTHWPARLSLVWVALAAGESREAEQQLSGFAEWCEAPACAHVESLQAQAWLAAERSDWETAAQALGPGKAEMRADAAKRGARPSYAWWLRQKRSGELR